MTEKEEGKLKQLKAGMRQKETECKRCPYHVFRSKEHCEKTTMTEERSRKTSGKTRKGEKHNDRTTAEKI